jgi:hypothetical protein
MQVMGPLRVIIYFAQSFKDQYLETKDVFSKSDPVTSMNFLIFIQGTDLRQYFCIAVGRRMVSV